MGGYSWNVNWVAYLGGIYTKGILTGFYGILIKIVISKYIPTDMYTYQHPYEIRSTLKCLIII